MKLLILKFELLFKLQYGSLVGFRFSLTRLRFVFLRTWWKWWVAWLCSFPRLCSQRFGNDSTYIS